MNAVADQDAPIRRARKIHGLDDSALDYELEQWGKWVEEHRHLTGHPTCDSVQSFVNGCGGGIKGHRILGPVMPERIQRTQLRIMAVCSEGERQAIELRYVDVLNDDNQVRSLKERCALAGISPDAFAKRLRRARLRLLGLPVDE